MSSDYDFIAKILMIGETGVGKTCLLQRYCETCFCTNDYTIGVEFKTKIIQVDEKKVKLQIWDTAGQERFGIITKSYYKGAMGIILCYAINNRESFEQLRHWMEEIRKYASNDVCIVLVGTKSDLHEERIVGIDEGRQLAESYGIKFIETSAKGKMNIDEAFLMLARDTVQVFGDKDAAKKLQMPEGKSESSKCF